MDTHGLHLDPIRTELVLELEEGSGNRPGYCDYYIGSVGPDTVFWFDEFKVANLEIWKAVPGATPTDANIGMASAERDDEADTELIIT